MRRRKSILSALLVASLLSPVSYAEELQPVKATDFVVRTSAKPVSPKAENQPVYQNVKGTQKVLCVMVNLKENPFNSKHNEKFYYNEYFGKGTDSVASYVKHESNGKFNIKPADTFKTKYPGVIKVDIDGSDYGTIGADSLRKQSEFFYDVMYAVKDQINFKAIDVNGDKELVQPIDSLGDPNLLRELEVVIIVSGHVDSPTSTRQGRIQFWPRSEKRIGNFNDYYLSPRVTMTSEYVEDYEAASPILTHEFLHNLDAKDMYYDTTSIGKWSIMCYHNLKQNGKNYQAPLDPMHKLYFGWSKPVKVSGTVEVKRNQIPYIVDSANPDTIYVLDYRDAKDKYQKRFGMQNDCLLVWKVNKSTALEDWDGYLGQAEGGTHVYSEFINRFGPGTSMSVINKSGTPVGGKISVGGTTIEVGDHVLTVGGAK